MVKFMKFMYGIKNTQNQTDKSFNSINSAGIPLLFKAMEI